MSRLWERRVTRSGHVDLIQDGDDWHRFNLVDPTAGNRERDLIRALPGKCPDWAPMAFNFTEAEYEWLQAKRPELFDPDPAVKARNWKAWAASSEGRQFRVR